MPAPAEVQTATLEKFIEGWARWTPEGFMETWSDDCTQQNLPLSTKAPVKSRADAKHLFPILMSLMSNFKLTVHNVVHDVPQGKAVIYALTKADTPFGPYQNEHALFMWFDESGEKVQKIEELFDTVVMKEFLPKIEQYVADVTASEGAQRQT